MSEELEWELYDVFEAGLFAFPLYEHQTARKIVRYLIYRGVLEEEIADAIEDSTIDLHIWLNRQGKNMVGEWVIAWVNDVRDEYLAEKGREGSEAGYEFRETMSREQTPYSENEPSHGSAPDGGGTTRRRNRNRRSREMITPDDSSSSDTNSQDNDDFDETEVKRPISPPPLPPRTLTLRRDVSHLRHIDSDSSSMHSDGDHSPNELIHVTFTRREPEFYERTPDSGAVSDIYSSIPHDNAYPSKDRAYTPTDNDTESTNTVTHCLTHGTEHIVTQSGLKICPNCTCTLAHYAYLNKPTLSLCNSHPAPRVSTPDSLTTTKLDEPVPMCTLHHHDSDSGYIFTESTLRAMELHIDTLDRDGPGYIFIMTDSLENCLPWSSEHRYKVASSRRPERFVTEFRAMNISIELIWQVRVENHSKAVKEIHSCLNKYNLHSNWFKCSLSVIMDTISKTVRKYRSA